MRGIEGQGHIVQPEIKAAHRTAIPISTQNFFSESRIPLWFLCRHLVEMNRGEDILVDGLREMVAQQQADDLARKGRITQE